ncbi:hypothetical protein C0993_008891 [Termitomyces sp. T159_Od127]|nr:hypothetical protein C0993_008891 [Termitomyces sp. T159_Od127]
MLPRCVVPVRLSFARCDQAPQKSIRLQIRKFTLDCKTSPWTQPDPYHPGKRLDLALPGRAETLTVQIAHAYPPTCSVVLLVDTRRAPADMLVPARAIVKLADRRWGDGRSALGSDPAWPWTVDAEREFQAGLRAYLGAYGRVPADVWARSWWRRAPRGPKVGDDDEEEEEEEEEKEKNDDDDVDPRWVRELRRWSDFDAMHQAEKTAYSYLGDAQERGYVPRFYGAVRIDMSSPESEKVHPSVDHINGLVMEYVPGRSMDSLEPGVDVSHEAAEAIAQKVLTLGRRLRHYGVAHNDIQLRNIVLRAPSDDPVMIDWGVSDCKIAQADMSAEEKWASTILRLDFHNDLRKVLQWSHRRWHQHSTPLSDRYREETAEEAGWSWANGIVSRSPEKQEMFYYRDHSVVDKDSGLMWKLKPNVKSRHIDDPYEPLPEK